MRDVRDFGQHDDIELGLGRSADSGNHLDDVGVSPRRGPVVDPDAAQLPGPSRLGQRSGHPRAGRGLRVRRDGIFQIQEDLIGGKTFGLVDHLLAATRH